MSRILTKNLPQLLYLIFFITIGGFSKLAFAQAKVNKKADSLQQLLRTPLADKQKVDVLLALINTYILKNPEKAYHHCQKALKLSKKTGYKQGMAHSYDRLGVYYKHAGEFEKSLSHHLKALKIYEEIKEEDKIAATLGNIGVVYKNLKDYPTAFKYQFKALKIMKKLGKEGLVANTYNNIGLLYFKTKKYTQALDYFDKTLKIDEKTNYQFGLASDYSNIALVWQKLGKYKKALNTEKEALKIRLKLHNHHGSMISYHNIAYIYKDTQEYRLAIEHFQKSLQIAQKINAQHYVSSNYQGLARVYEAQQQSTKALAFFKKFKATHDSVINRDKNKQIARMQTLYKTEKTARENQLLKQEKQIQKDALDRQQYINLFISVALLITLGFIYLGYKLYQQKKKGFQQLQQLNNEINEQNRVLQQKQSEILEHQEVLARQNEEIFTQKEEIALQAEELQVTNEQLLKLDKFKQSLTGMIVHDLKNPLNTIIGLSEDKYSPHFQNAINQSGKQMLNLVMNILDVQRFEETEMKLHTKSYPLKKIIKKVHQGVATLLTDKNIAFSEDIPDHLYLMVDEPLIVRVFTNLISNAIKYSFPGGKINVGLSNQESTHTHQRVLIKDNGTGIPADFLPNIFDKFSQHNPKVRSTGLGLTFCKLVIESHQGTIGVVSELNQGSTFWLSLPKAPSQGLEVPKDNQSLLSEDKGLEDEKESFIPFTKEEIALLQPFIEELRHFEIYEVSAIKKQLEKLPSSHSAITEWRIELENTLYAWNETRYQQLLDIVIQTDSE